MQIRKVVKAKIEKDLGERRPRMRSSSSFGKSSDSAAATVVTPGWCVVEYEVMKSKRHEHRRDPVVEDTSDEVYINRHRLVELRER